MARTDDNEPLRDAPAPSFVCTYCERSVREMGVHMKSGTWVGDRSICASCMIRAIDKALGWSQPLPEVTP